MSNITLELSKKQKQKQQVIGMQTVKESLQIQEGIFSTEEQVERQPEKRGRFVVYHENV